MVGRSVVLVSMMVWWLCGSENGVADDRTERDQGFAMDQLDLPVFVSAQS